MFQIQYPLPSRHHLVHQEVVLLVALHQAPNHMALRVVLPLPAVPQVVPGVHTAHREVCEALHQHLRTLYLNQLNEDKLYNHNATMCKYNRTAWTQMTIRKLPH